MSIHSGDVVLLDSRAAAAFAAHPMVYLAERVESDHDRPGWAWLDGYELDSTGKALDRREVYVYTEELARAQL